MATIAELRLPATAIGVATAFERVPALTCELERVVADTDFGVWLSGADREPIEEALDADPTVESYELITTDADESRWLYTIAYPEPLVDFLAVIAAEGGTVLTASGADGQWTIRLRFVDHKSVRRVHDALRDRGVAVDLRQIYEMTEETSTELGLTKEQYDALVAALNSSYFAIPRETSLDDLAADLDVSRQALSERLRRGFETLATARLGGSDSEGGQPDRVG